MMNAKKLFEELNYELVENTEERLLYVNNYYPKYIEFDKFKCLVSKYETRHIFDYKYTTIPYGITFKELEAVNRQVKELGWHD